MSRWVRPTGGPRDVVLAKGVITVGDDGLSMVPHDIDSLARAMPRANPVWSARVISPGVRFGPPPTIAAYEIV